MINTSLKRILMPLILSVAAIGLSAGAYLDFYHSNNYVNWARDKEIYDFQVRKTKGPFTIRTFTKSNLENSPREVYSENSFLIGTKHYADEPLDGLVDKITIYRTFANKPSLDLIRTKDYDNFKPEFKKADEDFAKNRKDFVKEMQKYEFN